MFFPTFKPLRQLHTLLSTIRARALGLIVGKAGQYQGETGFVGTTTQRLLFAAIVEMILTL